MLEILQLVGCACLIQGMYSFLLENEPVDTKKAWFKVLGGIAIILIAIGVKKLGMVG